MHAHSGSGSGWRDPALHSFVKCARQFTERFTKIGRGNCGLMLVDLQQEGLGLAAQSFFQTDFFLLVKLAQNVVKQHEAHLC